MAISLDFLDKLQTPFYFGAGGIGDALLLLSTFFDDHSKKNSSIVFWANDRNTAKEFFDLFQEKMYNGGLKNVVVFQGHGTLEDYKQIVSHKLFAGKGHFPDDMNFAKEWAYNAAKYRALMKVPFETLKERKFNAGKFSYYTIGLSPVGSSVDDWKIKNLSVLEFTSLITSLRSRHPEAHIILFGTKREKEVYGTFENDKHIHDVRGYCFQATILEINRCNHIIATDSFVKTISGLLEIPTTIIANRYTKSPKDIFGFIDYDPADNIFLKDWPSFTIRHIDDILKNGITIS